MERFFGYGNSTFQDIILEPPTYIHAKPRRGSGSISALYASGLEIAPCVKAYSFMKVFFPLLLIQEKQAVSYKGMNETLGSCLLEACPGSWNSVVKIHVLSILT